MATNRPHIIVITTHDTGAHIGCYGVPSVCTPAIDALAADGVRCTGMFATASMCSPSRGSLLTGLYPESNGLLGLAGRHYAYELNEPRQHLSHVLRAAGYLTALFGHQHEAADPYRTLGFDHYDSETVFGNRIWAQREALAIDDLRPQTAPEVARRVAAFLPHAARLRQPLFLQIGFWETHTPYSLGGCPPDEERGVWLPPYTACAEDEDLRRHVAAFQGSIRRVDEAVATIVEALRANGIERDTLLLFSSDHGPELPRAKWTAFDAGARIAFILRWPGGGLCGGKDCGLLLSNVDFVPTLLELIGLPTPAYAQGHSFAPALRATEPMAPVRDEVAFSFFYGHNYAVRTGRHKLIRNWRGTCQNHHEFRRTAAVPLVELYDIQADPLELDNLAGRPEHAAVQAEMEGRLWRHMEAVGAPVLQGPIAYPPYRTAMEEYRGRAGRWGEGWRGLSERRREGARYTVSTPACCLRRDLGSIYMPHALQLYDLHEDPGCTRNVAFDPAYAVALQEMNERFWGWLEAEDDPILRGPHTPRDAARAEAESLEAHQKWRCATCS